MRKMDGSIRTVSDRHKLISVNRIAHPQRPLTESAVVTGSHWINVTERYAKNPSMSTEFADFVLHVNRPLLKAEAGLKRYLGRPNKQCKASPQKIGEVP